MPEMLAVPAAAAALLHPAAFGQNEGRFARDIGDQFEPWRAQGRRIDGDTGIDQGALAVVDFKHLAGKGPEVVDRGLRTGVALRGAVAEPDDPFRAMPDVIGAFLFGF